MHEWLPFHPYHHCQGTSTTAIVFYAPQFNASPLLPTGSHLRKLDTKDYDRLGRDSKVNGLAKEGSSTPSVAAASFSQQLNRMTHHNCVQKTIA
ncbi:hypothetical protein SK128_015073 [Halocaridina rubra]|uniref:Uncharacterized protein n=1 Tax=Halocaridina rubra TaxID=373956 RepID=A0AAN8ZVJ0_HALRR